MRFWNDVARQTKNCIKIWNMSSFSSFSLRKKWKKKCKTQFSHTLTGVRANRLKARCVFYSLLLPHPDGHSRVCLDPAKQHWPGGRNNVGKVKRKWGHEGENKIQTSQIDSLSRFLSDTPTRCFSDQTEKRIILQTLQWEKCHQTPHIHKKHINYCAANGPVLGSILDWKQVPQKPRRRKVGNKHFSHFILRTNLD